MKFFSTICSLVASWEDVATALMKRYPNPHSKHVLSEDVVERKVINGKLHTVKFITKTNSMPSWGRRLYSGPDYVSVVEESICDPILGTFTTYTRNVSMGRFLSVTEKCQYSYHDHLQTTVKKSIWLDSSMGYGISRAILEFALPRYKKNERKATLGLQHVIDNTEPITLSQLVKNSKEKATQLAQGKVEITRERIHITKERLTKRAKKASAHVQVNAQEQDV